MITLPYAYETSITIPEKQTESSTIDLFCCYGTTMALLFFCFVDGFHYRCKIKCYIYDIIVLKFTSQWILYTFCADFQQTMKVM